MAKWFGKIGFAETTETKPGVWGGLVEHEYYGDILQSNRRLQSSSDQVNDNVTINNQISIVSDPYAVEHFHNIRYLELFGTKWKVTNVDVQFPRLVLTLGEVYNA